MRDVIIAGAGMTAFGRFPNSSVRSLAEEACRAALVDADLGPSDIETVYFGNAVGGLMTGQEMIRGQVALRNTGVLGVPIVNVENACSSASTAFYLAWIAVASGAVEVALAVGAEKMTHADRTRSLSAIGAALDLHASPETRRSIERDLFGLPSADGLEDAATTASPFMEVYADMTEDYMRSSGATRADFASVAVKARQHAAANDKAQYRDALTVDAVLASRRIAGPLTLYMCSPIGDGAAAVVLCSTDYARRLDVTPIRIRGCVLLSGRERVAGEESVEQRAAARVYEESGVGPEDLDVIEVHDAAAPAELMLYEKLGLCPPGEGAKLLASGATTLGGQVPVNPSGGLLARGHPIGATGCAQLVELVDQLRGRCGPRQVPGARIALAENGGGFLGNDSAATVTTILSR